MAQSYKIMSIEAKDLFGAMNHVNPEEREYKKNAFWLVRKSKRC